MDFCGGKELTHRRLPLILQWSKVPERGGDKLQAAPCLNSVPALIAARAAASGAEAAAGRPAKELRLSAVSTAAGAVESRGPASWPYTEQGGGLRLPSNQGAHWQRHGARRGWGCTNAARRSESRNLVGSSGGGFAEAHVVSDSLRSLEGCGQSSIRP